MLTLTYSTYSFKDGNVYKDDRFLRKTNRPFEVWFGCVVCNRSWRDVETLQVIVECGHILCARNGLVLFMSLLELVLYDTVNKKVLRCMQTGGYSSSNSFGITAKGLISIVRSSTLSLCIQKGSISGYERSIAKTDPYSSARIVFDDHYLFRFTYCRRYKVFVYDLERHQWYKGYFMMNELPDYYHRGILYKEAMQGSTHVIRRWKVPDMNNERVKVLTTLLPIDDVLSVIHNFLGISFE